MALERTERDEHIAFLLGQISGGLLQLKNSGETKEQMIAKIELLLDLINVSIGRLYYSKGVEK